MARGCENNAQYIFQVDKRETRERSSFDASFLLCRSSAMTAPDTPTTVLFYQVFYQGQVLLPMRFILFIQHGQTTCPSYDSDFTRLSSEGDFAILD